MAQQQQQQRESLLGEHDCAFWGYSRSALHRAQIVRLDSTAVQRMAYSGSQGGVHAAVVRAPPPRPGQVASGTQQQQLPQWDSLVRDIDHVSLAFSPVFAALRSQIILQPVEYSASQQGFPAEAVTALPPPAEQIASSIAQQQQQRDKPPITLHRQSEQQEEAVVQHEQPQQQGNQFQQQGNHFSLLWPDMAILAAVLRDIELATQSRRRSSVYARAMEEAQAREERAQSDNIILAVDHIERGMHMDRLREAEVAMQSKSSTLLQEDMWGEEAEVPQREHGMPGAPPGRGLLPEELGAQLPFWTPSTEHGAYLAGGLAELQVASNLSGALNLRVQRVMVPSVESLLSDLEMIQTGSFVWLKGPLLGEGANGRVFMGYDKETGQPMAVKQLKLEEVRKDQLRTLEREIALHRKMQHPHIVDFISSERDHVSGYPYIFLEFVSGGSISSMLKDSHGLREEVVSHYTYQLLRALVYLHEELKVVHRDIKGENILVTADGVVKLADFGAAKEYSACVQTNGCQTFRGSVYWMAPEVLKGNKYGRKADIWSLGCTVVEMLTGSHPWPGVTDSVWGAISHIGDTLTGPPIPLSASASARDFLKRCFALDPQERPTASELLKHPFVAQAESLA